ncbi:MAG TPA: sialate O-acetylesterase [Puia sp.]|nr:sialate O-acetylesterase [Puia sp.]
MKTPFIILFVLLYFDSFSQLHLSAIFNDHMVLQRDKPIKIWGTTNSGDEVTVLIGDKKESAIADKNGRWFITIPAFQAGGPYTLTVKTKKETKIYNDVLVGEVWLCSGQSNMQFRVRQAVNAKYEMHRANNPQIRQLEIPNMLSFKPEEFIDTAKWTMSTPETTGDFTAVGFFFARDIYEKLHIPIGLIYDNWGGSNVECWISKNDMLGSDELREYARQMSNSWEQTNARIEKQLMSALMKNNDGIKPDMNEADYLNPDFKFSGWMATSAPGDLDWIGLPAYRGEVYMMKELIIDSVKSGLPSVLSLGTEDFRFSIFLNGKQLSIPEGKNILIPLIPGTWKPGKNIILVKIGGQPVPDKMTIGIHGAYDLLYVDFDGERISLADEKWKVLPLLDRPHHFMKWMNNEGTIIYNAMIHPIIPLSIRGVLWYQGEANVDHAYEYRKIFPLMISSWRKEWKDEFPFLFVQLASFGSDESSNAGNKWAEIRESQSKALDLPKTGMAVTTDIGEAKDVHPKNKQDVGHRLAAIALNDVYAMPQICSGPVFKSVTFSNGKAVLSFASIGKGLVSKNRYGALEGFEIAGTDRKFYFAKASIHGDLVEVSADSVTSPVAVRYGWSNSPLEINLYNVEGFPASPFRTDDWPGVTDKERFYKP